MLCVVFVVVQVCDLLCHVLLMFVWCCFRVVLVALFVFALFEICVVFVVVQVCDLVCHVLLMFVWWCFCLLRLLCC